MALTTLNLGQVTPERASARPSTNCPQCGAKKDARVAGGKSFGAYAEVTYCGKCGYEFPSERQR